MHLIQETEPEHPPDSEELLRVSGLRISFVTRSGVIQAIDDVSFEIKPGETLGLVGETGCGKTQTAISIMRLTPEAGIIEKGEIWFRGTNLAKDIDKEFRIVSKKNRKVLKRNKARLNNLERELADIRGNHISMVFQEPMTSLNPVRTIGRQVSEVLLTHDLPRLSNRILARHAVPPEALSEVADSLAHQRGSRENIRELVGKYDLPGLEEQITSVIYRRDISEGSKIKRIKDLKQQVNSASLSFLRGVSAQGKIPTAYRFPDRIPILRARFLGILEKEALAVSAELLSMVGMPNISSVLKGYPHELSGGMRQRVMIAMAIAASPELIIADEPTSALDVTIQAQILQLFRELKANLNTSILFISHDMGVIAEICDRVGIMYAGNLVEIADIEDLFSDPRHPYTKGLLSAIPPSDRKVESLGLIRGSVPNLMNPPAGCRFNTRCPFVFQKCSQMPPPIPVKEGHYVRCWLYEK